MKSSQRRNKSTVLKKMKLFGKSQNIKKQHSQKIFGNNKLFFWSLNQFGLNHFGLKNINGERSARRKCKALRFRDRWSIIINQSNFNKNASNRVLIIIFGLSNKKKYIIFVSVKKILFIYLLGKLLLLLCSGAICFQLFIFFCVGKTL